MDRISGKKFVIQTRSLILAAGPWTDILEESWLASKKKKLRLTKGVHILVPSRGFSSKRAIAMLSPIDGRVTFAVPWENRLLIGTTDTDYTEQVDHVGVSEKDKRYLLDTFNAHFPQHTLKEQDIISTMAGLRCLIRQDQLNPSKVSREHWLEEPYPGVLIIAGGKLTTFRSMGEHALEKVIRSAGLPASVAKKGTHISGTIRNFMDKKLVSSDIRKLIRDYHVTNFEDLLGRRTLVQFLEPSHGFELLDAIAKELQEEFGYDESELVKLRADYMESVQRYS
ncbi:MAG: FAD-dependent oxidoreductase [Bdellovibrionota bacterium]